MPRNAIMIIDHEPKAGKKADNKARHEAPRVELEPETQPLAAHERVNREYSRPERFQKDQSQPSFGKRNKSAVTNDFFNHGSIPAGETGVKTSGQSSYRDFGGASSLSALPIKSLAAVFTIALLVPFSFIALTERSNNENVDPITTASLAQNSDIKIDDISMTKILKSGTSVISVFGKISNTSSTTSNIGEVTITLRDKRGKRLQTWKHQTGIERLETGKSLRFITSAIDVKGTGHSVSVSANTQN